MNQMDSDSGTTSNTPSKRLVGKVAVVTGGARGIGAATARALAASGAHVVIADVLDKPGSDLAASIDGRYSHCDVSVERDVERAVRMALDWKGRLDIMFNNAGVAGPDGSITALETDQLASLLAVNLHGVVHGIKHAARAMIEGENKGTIICTSSSAAVMGGLAGHAYTMSKGAILALARSTACELGAYGIRVNCVSPHGVPSEMLVGGYRRVLGDPSLGEEDVRRIVREGGMSVLRGRVASVEDVARGVLFLASDDDSGFVTGHNLVIDGGFTSANNQMSLMYHNSQPR
ncbi:NAD(P)-binding Rossmann-fold superfamily protein [Striga asiatica]|uniref:NAD(P)-binding Rossmann-fold superfamily protein n=1 Tax=Striga asiatica TaxID=4170 RepID=A0A5A7QUI3_STRAF|nr:NAD(P)-binding Rossmann-fold superfamily protein [Striga asiatica]